MSQWKIVSDVNLYFTTSTIVDWEYVFTSDEYFQIVIDSLKYCIAKKGLNLHGYVIMPNHAHFIVSGDEGKKLSNIMRDFGTHTSREITTLLKMNGRVRLLNVFRDAARFDHLGNEFKVWQEGFHPIAIESEEFFRQKLNYLHDNPVRKGFVELPEHWKYSSARNYILDDQSVIEVEMFI